MIEIKGLHKHFINSDGDKIEILNDINLSVKEGEFITIFGPNGCGKSTLMNIIAGIEEQSGGEVLFNKDSVEFGYIFQDYRPTLLPWKNAWQNIGLPLFWKGLDEKEIHERVKNMLRNLDISIDLNAYPFTLSGGQAQLVCILRSLIIKPDILISDEPFSALDYLNRMNLILKMQDIWNAFKPTTLFISHDIEEAIFLGDKVIILSQKPGKIIEVLEVPIPKPRGIDTFIHSDFIKIKEKAMEIINEAYALG